jgi:hypothetical protein
MERKPSFSFIENQLTFKSVKNLNLILFKVYIVI